ncbi:MAG TPA: hypothetical protein VLF91_01930 [Candidatus Saccharimonadales bacterium]|nr:hypothetical protein [Candidatus Saccharimonadales bacterium]
MKQRVNDLVARLRGSHFGKLAQRHPRRTEFLLANLVFGGLAALFMGPILFHFGSAVHGFWGDGTGGLIWLNTLHLGPFGGTTNTVLYPYGDNLFRPDLITASLLVLPFWLLSHIFGAVAAWNCIIFAAFWLCGISMYYLVKRLTRSSMAALWAGVAFAYLPMHQYKAFGHIAYELMFIFVFVLWQLLRFIELPSKKRAVGLGLLFALPFYVDGYYVLFALILVGVPLLCLSAKYIWQVSKTNLAQTKRFFVSLGVFLLTGFVALLPIVYVQLVYGAQIASSLSLARGDFMANVYAYTARWYDYLLPIETHPVFGKAVVAFRAIHHHDSNTSEQTLYLGVVLIALTLWTLYYFWKRRKAAKMNETPVSRQTIWLLTVVAVVAFAITLPPAFHLLGHRVPLPSGVISKFVQFWRVYARLVLLIDLVLVVVAATGLAVLLKRIRRPVLAWGLTALLIVATLFEYLSFNPFHRQDIWYYGKLSAADRWLAAQQDIKVIAVYPLVDEPNGLASLYTTEQQINHKKMINSGTVTTKGAPLRVSISGLADPQTLPVLKALGAQAIMTHEIPGDQSVAGLHLLYGANEAPAGYAADVDVFGIDQSIPAAKYALVPASGLANVPQNDLTEHYVFGTDGQASLQVVALPGVSVAPGDMRTIQFAMHATNAYAGCDVVVSQGDKVMDVIHLAAGQTMSEQYSVATGQDVQLRVVGSLAPSSLYLTSFTAD